MREKQVIYLPHPVSRERKKQLHAEGFRIIDIRFAPKGHDTGERDALEARAASLGIKVDARWKDETLRRKIEEIA